MKEKGLYSLWGLFSGLVKKSLKVLLFGVPIAAQQVKNLTSICEDAGLMPGFAQGVKDRGVATCCGIGHRRSSDPMLVWLWTAAATPIQPLAWELPYAAVQP